MNYRQILTTGFAATGLSIASLVTPFTTAISRADGTPAEACINRAVFKLNGIPRSAISATAGDLAADGTRHISWKTRTGGAGNCWVDSANQVVQFEIEVDPSVQPNSSTSNFAVAGKSVMVNTSGGSLNIRSSPGGDIIGTALNGSTLVLTGQTSSEWVEIEGGGWVSQYLLAETVTPTAPASSATHPSSPVDSSSKQAIVATDGGGLNVRSKPDGEITASLTDGAIVTLTGQKNGSWVEIEGGGWVSADYLKYQ